MQGMEFQRDFCRESLADVVWSEFEKIKAGAVKKEEIFASLERPKDGKMGDYALPCFRFAKPLQKKPPGLAGELAHALQAQLSPLLSKVVAAGPFLNFTLATPALAAYLLPAVSTQRFFTVLKENPVPKTMPVMIEYSQPNTHKVFHVGHMRNVALGDCLWRLYEYCGYPAIPVNYIGDEGTHIAKCLWYMSKTKEQPPASNKGEWLGEMYTKSTTKLEDATPEEKTQYEDEISQVLAQIEAKSGKFFDLWKTTRQWSLDVFNEIYAWLGARFDHVFYESEVSEASQGIVEEFLKKGVFITSDGAIGIDLSDDKLGFLILRKRDGNTLYATKDLALARRKFEDFKIKKSIYVVGSEQNLHFRQVFKTLERMGFPQAKDCYHLSYALVVLPEGKMASRRGNIIPFSLLQSRLGEELAQYLVKYEGEWSAEEIAETSRRLCVGAIRYGMLCSDPNKEIVFDIKNWLSFEGDTGPYLMYSYARSLSILRKGKEGGHVPSVNEADVLAGEETHELLRNLYDFNEVVDNACSSNKPSLLTHYLFDLCKSFNRFHRNVPVLKAESETQRGALLALVQSFSLVLAQGLHLLGITPPERM